MITSRQNPKVKAARALRNRKARTEAGLCLVEGLWHVGEAVEAGVVETLFYAPEQLTSAFGYELIAKVEEQSESVFSVSAEVLAALAEKASPTGIVAVARQRVRELKTLSPTDFPWLVALVTPQDPGNLGTILRTIDAAGASGLIVLDGGADPWHPTAIRASMGMCFSVPVARASFPAFVDWAQDHAYTLYGTSAFGRDLISDAMTFTKPCVLLMGSEREGLTDAQQAACTHMLRLPMDGRVRSLNLAVATGVLLYQMKGKMGSE
jgi:TrmH family RNA methyltransferase